MPSTVGAWLARRRSGAVREDPALQVALWAGAALVLLGWADATVHNVSETLFLKRVGVEWLPLAFLASSLLLVASTYLVGRRMAAGDRLSVLPVAYVAGGVTLALVAVLLISDRRGPFVLLLLVSKQLRAVGLLALWLALGDLLNAQQAKRVFAPVTAGFTLGAIGGSFTSGPLGAIFGPEPLVWIAACLLLASAALTMRLASHRRARLEHGFHGRARRHEQALPSARPAPSVSLGDLVRGSRLFRLLAVSTVCAGLLGPFLYFQFSFVADAATSGSDAEQSLLSLYAQFWGWTNVVVLATQLAVSGRLYRWIGIPASLAISPAVYLLGFGALSVRMSLPAGAGAMAVSRLTDHAIYDPAMPVIYNLFSERLRPRAAALLEGPIKRSAAAVGNIGVLLVLAAGAGASLVSYLALPVAAAWLLAAGVLWRRYPEILLSSSAAWTAKLGDEELGELLDRSTVRTLRTIAMGDDPDARHAAIEIIVDADPAAAVEALSELAAEGPVALRTAAIAGLATVLRRITDCPTTTPAIVADLTRAVGSAVELPEHSRVALVQAYDRLAPDDDAKRTVLRGAVEDGSPAVSLAARSALQRSAGEEPAGIDAALASPNATLVRAAVDELRSSLLCSEHRLDDATWSARLTTLAGATDNAQTRPYVMDALVDVARGHGARAAIVADTVLALRSDADVGVRAGALAFVGHAGLSEHASCLAHALTDGSEAEVGAAREGLLALGCAAIEPLLDHYWFGRRRARNEILDIVGELDADPRLLRGILERELDAAARNILVRQALDRVDAADLVLSRLAERTQQELHTVLLLLATLEDRPRVAEVAALLRRAHDAGERSILLEALDSLLSLEEKEQLLPLIDGRGPVATIAWAARRLDSAPMDRETAVAAALEDPDELTRTLARVELSRSSVPAEEVAVLEQVDIAVLLGSVPLFDRLTTRQLMELAAMARPEKFGAGRTLFSEGSPGSAMYVIVEGRVFVQAGGRTLRTLGTHEFFGELALIDNETRSATVTAEIDVRLLRLEREDFLALLEESPSVAIEFSRALARRLRVTNQLS